MHPFASANTITTASQPLICFGIPLATYLANATRKRTINPIFSIVFAASQLNIHIGYHYWSLSGGCLASQFSSQKTICCFTLWSSVQPNNMFLPLTKQARFGNQMAHAQFMMFYL
ncbi:hypothetical protein EAF00_001644 [Botryotinia globosa]|nr:hypothetical protein EAF00_001644 [Botryotinia globosa]